MSKFKIEFSLKQHTPLIHFQSEQSGATLRATELKPKFDEFLREMFKKEQIEYKDFLISGQERALDYKVRIEQNISKREEIGAKNPLFFGNMKPKDKTDVEWELLKKRFKNTDKKFKIEFFSFNLKVLEAIKNNFEAFVANTNFGTRQTKGFGCFYIEGKSFDKGLVNHNVYSFSSTEDKWDEDIKSFYSFLRAGVNTANFGGIYAKAIIFAYAKSKGITWDKKAIKNFYLDNKQSDPSERLMRDLFGLSFTQSWKSYNNATITKDDPTKEVARFKSPITFKPIKEGKGMRIYFWADKSVEDILNREFVVNFDRKKGLKLKTPNEFSFDDFFEFSFNLDLSKYIDSEYHNNGQYMKLVSIFNEIKESK